MAVKITKGGKPVCAYCGGTGKKTHEIISKNHQVEMTLPCLMCRTFNNVPYLGLRNAANCKPDDAEPDFPHSRPKNS